jgi:hypothetical protein
MLFLVSVPLFLAIPIWICMSIAANNRAKKLAAIARETTLNEARLVKQVEHLPNSGVTALDIARADQVLKRHANSGLSWSQTAAVLGVCFVITFVIGGISEANKSKSQSAVAAPSATPFSATTVSATPSDTLKDSDFKHESDYIAEAAASASPTAESAASPIVKHHHKHSH